MQAREEELPSNLTSQTPEVISSTKTHLKGNLSNECSKVRSFKRVKFMIKIIGTTKEK
jgi:hypothetical protein